MLILLILNLLPATPSIPLIPAFHTTPMPTRQTPLTARSQHLPKHLRSNCRNICAAPAEASAQPMLDGDSLPVRYGIHGQREGIVLYQHLEELLRGVFAIGAFEKME